MIIRINGELGHFNFWLSLSLSDSLSETLSWTLKSGLRPKFNLTLDLTFAKPVLNKRRHCNLVNSRAMVGIKLLFRQPQWQVHIFHRSAQGSQQICISAPHSSLRTNCNCISSNPRHVLCLYETHSDVISFRSAIKVKVTLVSAKVKP